MPVIHVVLFLWISRSVAAAFRGLTPSFVSDWVNMTANSPSSSVSVDHGLGELPLRVIIEARTEEGWIFPGFGSAQADDDKDVPYGGVVFIYNEVNIQMYVPHRNNGRRIKSKWTALYLGNENKWVGPDQLTRQYTSVLVRAKAWKPSDLPPPSWRSSAIHVQEGDCINTTLEHTFKTYPDLIVVQVQTPLGTFQGQGLSMLGYPISTIQHVGGLLYGVNETHLQLWSICNIDGRLKAYGLWSAQDGWGTNGMGPTLTGTITIFAWDLSKRAQHITKTLDLAYLQEIGYRIPLLNVAPDEFISVQIEVLEGPNKNFRFDGLGSVMTEVEPYGGLVYAYDEAEATVGIWVPHPNKATSEAAVFMLGMNWGWGFKQQMTDNVNIIISSVTITGCRCPCAMVGAVPIQANETEKLQQRIRELKAKLTIMKNETSKALRLKTSAYDPRQSAKSLGAVFGAGILIFVFGFILISDFPKLWSEIGRLVFIFRTRNPPKKNSD